MEDFYMTNSNSATTPWGISGSTLKIIALVTMLTDHIGAAILEPVLMQKAESMHILWGSYSDFILIDKTLGTAYIAMRYIGRIAFPIYSDENDWTCIISNFLFSSCRRISTYTQCQTLCLPPFTVCTDIRNPI